MVFLVYIQAEVVLGLCSANKPHREVTVHSHFSFFFFFFPCRDPATTNKSQDIIDGSTSADSPHSPSATVSKRQHPTWEHDGSNVPVW